MFYAKVYARPRLGLNDILGVWKYTAGKRGGGYNFFSPGFHHRFPISWPYVGVKVSSLPIGHPFLSLSLTVTTWFRTGFPAAVSETFSWRSIQTRELWCFPIIDCARLKEYSQEWWVSFPFYSFFFFGTYKMRGSVDSSGAVLSHCEKIPLTEGRSLSPNANPMAVYEFSKYQHSPLFLSK